MLPVRETTIIGEDSAYNMWNPISQDFNLRFI